MMKFPKLLRTPINQAASARAAPAVREFLTWYVPDDDMAIPNLWDRRKSVERPLFGPKSVVPTC
jgi:hypothetical protein